MKLRLFLTTALLAGCTNSPEPAAQAAIPTNPPRDIVGIELGVDGYTVPECNRQNEDGFNVYSIPYGPRPCTANSHASLNSPPTSEPDLGATTGPREIEVQIDPPFGVKSHAIVRMAGGRIERVLIPTSPVDAQRNVLDALTEKYGKPTSLQVRPMQNAFGAKFDSIEANWNLPSLEISFIGSGNLDEGVIVASVPGEASSRKPAKF